jgi:hypothetical protein
MTTLHDVEDAFDFVSFGESKDHVAFLCRATGEIRWHSESGDDEEPLPEDVDDPEKYIAIPDRHDLGLGKPLALRFAARELPEDLERVEDFFRHRGAYGRFRNLLAERGRLDEWSAFEAASRQQALREWCEDNGIELVEPPGEARSAP